MPLSKLQEDSRVIVIKSQFDFEELLLKSDLPLFYDDQKVYTITKQNITYVFFHNGLENIRKWINESNNRSD